MILAFDTYYFNDKAKTVCLAFANWTDGQPAKIYEELTDAVAEYEPGAFYKRELPCIISLLEKIGLTDVTAIVIDGFVVLDDRGKPGLGGHLYYHLKEQVPVIGVAKTDFVSLTHAKICLLRGESKNPLFITALGIDPDQAGEYIKGMSGHYRIPDLLKQLDSLTRKDRDS